VLFTHRVDRSLLAPTARHDRRRLGSAHDGGYVVPIEAITAARHLLSFGVATNWDFERDALMLNPDLTLDAFDPSVGPRHFAAIGIRSAVSAPLRLVTADVAGARSSARRAMNALDYFRFFSGRARHVPKRVWYNRDRDSAAISDIIADIRANDRGPVFAKIDIEGSEYRILPWIIQAADVFTGLVVEFHDTDICGEIFNAQLGSLLEHFQVAHVHGNNFGDVSIDGSLPVTLEISLVHRNVGASAHRSRMSSARRFDAPNDPSRPDYALDFGRSAAASA
jgi:hypothetical protein